jgi:hypothetical protein
MASRIERDRESKGGGEAGGVEGGESNEFDWNLRASESRAKKMNV